MKNFWFKYVIINSLEQDPQGPIQDLKLGVAQMDWSIWKEHRGVYCIDIFKMWSL